MRRSFSPCAIRFGHMIDDVVSNTYRALRLVPVTRSFRFYHNSAPSPARPLGPRPLSFVGDPVYGDLLYAEFTRLSDWHFQRPQARGAVSGGC